MVCDDVKVPALQKVAKMLNGKVHCKESLTDCAVFSFRWLQFLREKRERLPTRYVLLENCTDCHA